MRTLKRVEVKFEKVHFIPRDMQQGTIYVSEDYEIANHLCLCGCGVQAPTPLGEDGWKVSTEKGKLTMTPSILNPVCPANSHYIITNGIANFV